MLPVSRVIGANLNYKYIYNLEPVTVTAPDYIHTALNMLPLWNVCSQGVP